MSERINWSYKVEAIGGPVLIGNGSGLFDAYEKFAVTVPAPAGTSVVVDVLAGSGVQFLLLSSSSYEDVTYKVDDDTERPLDGAILLAGPGAIALLGDPLDQFTFTNNSATDVNISLFIARDATP